MQVADVHAQHQQGHQRQVDAADRQALTERDRVAQSTSPADLFVPVEVAGVVSDSRIEIVLAGGQRVNVPAGFDVTTLAQVVAVLEGRAC